jgi:hypothetical protein
MCADKCPLYLARLIYDITINILEINLRLAESFAALIKGAIVDLSKAGLVA